MPTEESVQLSLRTQQILAFESGTADVVDPLGGSYYVESLTNHLEEEALKYLKQIDDMGGAVTDIEHGFQVKEIGDAAYQHRQEVESGERTVVGVNRFVTESEPMQGLLRVDEQAALEQLARLEQVRRERDATAVNGALGRLKDVAHSNENTVPVILECVEANCTLGEICQVLRSVFGDQQEIAEF